MLLIILILELIKSDKSIFVILEHPLNIELQFVAFSSNINLTLFSDFVKSMSESLNFLGIDSSFNKNI